jgi:hypothetical protein
MKPRTNKEPLYIDLINLYNARFIYPAGYRAAAGEKLGCEDCYIREEDISFGTAVNNGGYAFKFNRNAENCDAVCCMGQRVGIAGDGWERMDFLGACAYGSYDDYFYLCRNAESEPHKIGFSSLEKPLTEFKEYCNHSMGFERAEIFRKSRVFAKYKQYLRKDIDYFHLYSVSVRFPQKVPAGAEIVLPDNMFIYIFSITVS